MAEPSGSFPGGIGVFGAGSIGCYFGGLLAAGGHKVALVGRPSVGRDIAAGMVLTRHDGMDRHVAGGSFGFSQSAAALAGCDVVLVCVKRGDTEEAARALGAAGVAGTVVSLQNGIGNAAILRRFLPAATVLAAMVPFNVTRIGANRFHCATDGTNLIEATPPGPAVAAAFSACGLPSRTHGDMEAVAWGKLLLNLNNAINALSGLPLKAQLSQPGYRQALALCMEEGLAAMKAAGIRPAKIGKVGPRWIPAILRLPDPLFSVVAASMLRIDEHARSSMADDIAIGRKAEIGWLQGEIVRLGQRVHVPAPANAAIVRLVEAAQRSGVQPAMDAAALLKAVSRPAPGLAGEPAGRR
jgi:2-dehydropantoate 2-reductase